MNRLRIAIVAPGFPLERDEPGLAAVVDLVERLAQQHYVRVFALRHPTPAAHYDLVGASVQALGLGRAHGALGRAQVLARGVSAVIRSHQRRRFDLVHGLWADESGAIAAIAGRLMRRPAVVSVMGGELMALPDIGYGSALGRGGRWTVKASLRLATAVTAGSDYVRNQALNARPGARVELLPLGVDTHTFSPAARGESHADANVATVLFAGSLEPVKDPVLALRVVADLARTRPGLRLVVAGDGRLRDQLAAAANQTGLAGRVTWLGQVRRTALPQTYRGATVLCITSRHEAQSMVAVEAAACGVPVVGFAVGIVPELAAAGGAIAVPRDDEAALTRALARVLDDVDHARSMGRAARAKADSDFDIETTSGRLLNLYRSLAPRAARGQ